MSEHSRTLRLAAGVTGATESVLERRLNRQHVTVSVAAGHDADVLTARVLLETLRRGPGAVHLLEARSDSEVLTRLVARAQAVDPGRGVDLVRRPIGTCIHVGEPPAPDDEAIRIVPDGYGVHLSRSAEPLARTRPPNPLGAVYAAAVGAAEVFKLAADVLPSRMTIHRDLRFCPVSLSADLAAAPELPGQLALDVMLVGLGAVGSAAALILGELCPTGIVTLIDPENYAPENLGTYTLGTAEDAEEGRTKVSLAAHALTGWKVNSRQGFIEQAIAAIDRGDVRWPEFVLCGLDSIEARHATQRVWPDTLIDASTGDTALGMQHVRGPGQPCLACLVQQPQSRRSATAQLSELTGLPTALLNRGDLALAEEHIASLAPKQRKRLSAFLGQPICGLARAYGLSTSEAGDFRPSVPFVSQQAACLGIGRVLAEKLGLAPAINVFQYDALLGPTSATAIHRNGQPTCYCAERAAVIAHIRRQRASTKPEIANGCNIRP